MQNGNQKVNNGPTKPRNASFRDFTSLVAVVQFIIVLAGGVYYFNNVSARLDSVEQRLGHVVHCRENESTAYRLTHIEDEITQLRRRVYGRGSRTGNGG